MHEQTQTSTSTMVIQSHCLPLPHAWLAPCIDSVKSWSKQEGFDYQFLGDELFELLPKWVVEKTHSQRVVATDLARLKCIQKFLSCGYERVVWLDADFLVFSPERFHLPDCSALPENYALGREVWVQPQALEKASLKARPTNKRERFKVYNKVHNAFLLFGQGNPFLDFYSAHAERLLDRVKGTVPPQFVGPKLLTALHNIVQCPVQEDAGMLSPWIIQDILNGGGPALHLFREKSLLPLAGANLCSSLLGSPVFKDNAYDDQALDDVVARLLSQGGI